MCVAQNDLAAPEIIDVVSSSLVYYVSNPFQAQVRNVQTRELTFESAGCTAFLSVSLYFVFKPEFSIVESSTESVAQLLSYELRRTSINSISLARK